MTYDEELRDAGRYFGDPLARADFLRDEARDHFNCQTCGAIAPAIIEGRYCCDCPDTEAFQRAREARLAKGVTP